VGVNKEYFVLEKKIKNSVCIASQGQNSITLQLSTSVARGGSLRERSSLIVYVENFEDAMHIQKIETNINSGQFTFKKEVQRWRFLIN